MNTARNEIRNALACVAIAMTALLIAWPFANLPFSDDFSWACTVKKLFETGHLSYNGWSSPSVIAQAYWGLLWVKCFGFSFNILRISTMPMAAGAVLLSYVLSRKAGLNAALSSFITLVLGLSPLFLPLASSFMTDVPGLFFLLLSIVALVIGYENNRARWITIGAIAALVGGSSRQVVWIVPLIVLPYLAWLRRSDRKFLLTAGACWLLVVIGAASMQRWFNHQPYAVPDPPVGSYFRGIIRYPKGFLICCLSTLLTSVCVILPAAIAIFSRQLRPSIRVASLFLILIIAAALALHHVLFPWLGNMVTPTGVLGYLELYGDRPTVLTAPMLAIISIVTFEVLALLMTRICMMRFNLPAPVPAAILLTMFGLLALELTRCVFDVAYDRHLLPFIPFAGIPMLIGFQRNGLKRMPFLAWFTLAIYAIYAIASTQELNSLARARASAIQKLKATGITADQIDGGFEHVYWTQAITAGHINDARLENPPGAYYPDQGPTPGIRFLYRLESKPTADTSPTDFGSVSYFSFLPPLHRKVFIDRFTDPWWLDPTRAATRPVPRQLISEILLREYPRSKK